MPKAIWKGAVIAESSDTVVVEGNHYFPVESVNQDLLRSSDRHTVCPWKGTAGYYDIVVDGDVNEGAAFFYPEPSKAASKIKDRVAFWRGVDVQDAPGKLKSLFGRRS